jgi:hypothetical protein
LAERVITFDEVAGRKRFEHLAKSCFRPMILSIFCPIFGRKDIKTFRCG